MPCRPHAWVLHGFNVRDGGAGSIDKLAPLLVAEGFEPMEFDYGWLGPLGVKALDGRLGRLLAKLVKPGDVVVAHSNGCCIAQLAAEQGAPFAVMAFISPALDRDSPVPANVGERHVWFSHSDEWVGKARWLPFVKWGDMGRVGHRPDSPRNFNFDGEEIFGTRIKHSGWFQEPIVNTAASAIVKLLARSHKNHSI
jgi:hypothetical protein